MSLGVANFRISRQIDSPWPYRTHALFRLAEMACLTAGARQNDKFRGSVLLTKSSAEFDGLGVASSGG